MRRLFPFIVLGLSLPAWAGKKKDAPVAPPPETPVAPADAPAVEAPPEPEPEPAPLAANADFVATFTFMDGTTRKGHVSTVERGVDRFAETGWTDAANKVTLTLEGGGTEIESAWKDVRSIDIKYAPVTDADCQFDTTFSPTMYMCVLRNTPTVKTADGKTWVGANMHHWRFHLDGQDAVEFYVTKLPARRQEGAEADLRDAGVENAALYGELQADLSALIKGKAVARLTIAPP